MRSCRTCSSPRRRTLWPVLEVEVTGGWLGGVERRGLAMWRGVPYAEASRFRAPQQPAPWAGVRDAAEFGPVAPQDREGQFIGPAKGVPMSEDCLTLNVIAPLTSSELEGELLPVMVFIHGGAYSVGSSREVRFLGEGLVRAGGVVFVNLNYRLGALGYLDFTRYGSASAPIERNLGLRDQVAALQWVRDNISAFGGDPANVTLFGESAGGNAVTTLMTVPSAHGLFARAIAQSPPPNAIYPPGIAAEWAEEYVEILSEIVDNSSTESSSPEEAGQLLLDASLEQLVTATTRMQLRNPDTWPGTICLSPVIDGEFLPERPLDAFKFGRAHPVPLIIGTNDREGSLFTGRLDILATTPHRIRAIFGKTRKKARRAVKAQYPGLPAKRPAADFAGDYAFWFPTVKVAERHSRFARTYFYRFDSAPRLLKVLGIDATHGLELFALFDRMDGWFGRAMGILGGRLSFKRVGERMQQRWLRFAHDGTVDADWPKYTARKRRTLIIDTVDRVEQDPRGERRRAWQEFVPHV